MLPLAAAELGGPSPRRSTSAAAGLYAPETRVTVNGGEAMTTPDAVATFLSNLRNQMGGTNMKFTITGCKALEDGTFEHTDTWTADNGTGSCLAVWKKQADGAMRILSDEITFVPKA